MKICYLVHDMNPKAGWGRLSNDLISGVKKAGHEITILKEIDDGFDGIPILKGGSGVFLASFRARKYLKTCDIIHTFDVYPYGVIVFLSTLFLKKKIVISLIGTYSVAPLYNWRTSFLSSVSLYFASIITSISEFTKKEVLKRVSLKNIIVITPGIDLKVFYKEHKESKEQFIISVGSLKERKGYHNSIPAFALSKKNLPNLKYKIVGNQGDFNYFSQLKRITKEYGVENDVQFLTNVSDDDLSLLYKEAKLFILPSVNVDHHFEGFGIVFLEAAAAGLPVIGTSGNGIEDAILNGHNGVLVPQNDIIKTSQSILDIVSNKEQWREMSAQSYLWAKENSVDGMIKKYISIYNGLFKS